ncbi:endonuclease/exonuclease/phosphatase family protein [Streptomyces tubbatahanensis]|uniref:Endonuclease/exonuclease/phosphatase family protein n=1 Tax=Streptomyces tubbatahanensis TaxID=2923272 RepID=A0ABY3XQF9_9ACTN|nr:endonuclease/exonuclease/phosphatase family protein [Streptomyces tubbatahanensis]UNS96702.1 endonuclease/exonuclease/phosphatase family protein [Streptomyces tubbatahanensis]
MRAITWNICGASKTACWDWSFGDRYGKVGELAGWVQRDPRVSVVMMNESCKAYYGNYLKKQLNATGTGNWRVNHVNGLDLEKKTPFTCDPDINQPKDAGVTIAVKQFPGGDPKPLTLTFPSTNGRPEGTQRAACFKDGPNKFLACTVHLPAGGADPDGRQRAATVQSLHDQLLAYQEKGYRTIVGGDFNLKPDDSEIKPMYEDNFEADPQHGDTQKTGKIDYMFFSDYGWDLLNGNPILTGGSDQYNQHRLSDHWMMQGTVRVEK